MSAKLQRFGANQMHRVDCTAARKALRLPCAGHEPDAPCRSALIANDRVRLGDVFSCGEYFAAPHGRQGQSLDPQRAVKSRAPRRIRGGESVDGSEPFCLAGRARGSHHRWTSQLLRPSPAMISARSSFVVEA